MRKQLLTTPLTDAQLALPEKTLLPVQNSFCIMLYGIEYLFGHFKSAVLILFPLSSFDPSLQMALALCITA